MSELDMIHGSIHNAKEMHDDDSRSALTDGYTYLSDNGCEVTLRFRTEPSEYLIEQVLNMLLHSFNDERIKL